MRSALIASAALCLAGCATAPKLSEKNLSIADLSIAVEKAWGEWMSAPKDPNDPRTHLKGVTLTTQLKEASSFESNFSVLVLSAKSKREVVSSRSVTVKLSPPSRLRTTSTRILDEELRLAFREADAVTKDLLRPDSKLALGDVGVSIGFDLIETAGGGFTLELGSIKVGPSASSSVTGTHKVDLVFGQK